MIDKNLVASEKQNLFIIIGSLILIIITSTSYFWQRLKRISSEKDNILTEQKLLRTQMTPHFLFNALSILQGIILNKEYKKSIKYLSRLSRLLRITLENSREKLVVIKDELDAIEKYIELQNLGADLPVDYVLTTNHQIDKDKLLLPPMMLQPFVENIFEHAFEEEHIQKVISIDLQMKSDDLICTIIDNGKGINQTQNTSQINKKSLSTAITTERLKLFAKELNVSTDLHIEDRKQYGRKGTVITLMLPYKIQAYD